jgi:hypothetical protein
MKRIKSDDDDDKILKDGARLRVSMTMRDSLSPLQRSVAASTQDAKPQFTDGHSIVDPAAGLKPGWRMPTVQDRTQVHDAYAKADRQMRNRYKCGDGEQLCDGCGGDGVDQDGNACDACHGKGVTSDKLLPDPASDHRPLDHQANMDQLYREHDAQLSNAWRTK